MTKNLNPCTGIKSFRETGRSSVYIENELYQMVWEKADIPTREAMDIAYLTGQRPADVLKLTESDIRDDVLYIQQNKTSRKVRIAITGELQTVLSSIADRKVAILSISKYLIVNEQGQHLTYSALRQRFDKARSAAGLKADQFQFRDLRAKAATDTEDLAHAQRLLGHASRTMTENYTRFRRGDLVSPTK